MIFPYVGRTGALIIPYRFIVRYSRLPTLGPSLIRLSFLLFYYISHILKSKPSESMYGRLNGGGLSIQYFHKPHRATHVC